MALAKDLCYCCTKCTVHSSAVCAICHVMVTIYFLFSFLEIIIFLFLTFALSTVHTDHWFALLKIVLSLTEINCRRRASHTDSLSYDVKSHFGALIKLNQPCICKCNIVSCSVVKNRRENKRVKVNVAAPVVPIGRERVQCRFSVNTQG